MHCSIFVVCTSSNVTAVSGIVYLTSTAVSSVNVSILVLVVVGMSAKYNLYLWRFPAVSLPWCLLLQNIRLLFLLQRFCCLDMIWISGGFVPGSVFRLFVRGFYGSLCQILSQCPWRGLYNIVSFLLLVKFRWWACAFALSWSVYFWIHIGDLILTFLPLLLLLDDRILFSRVFWNTQEVVILVCKM